MIIFPNLRDFSNLQLFHKLNSPLHSFFSQVLCLSFQSSSSIFQLKQTVTEELKGVCIHVHFKENPEAWRNFKPEK